MEKKGSILVKLPMQLYVSLHDRQLSNHISFLVSRLLEEFLKATDVRISWAEMPTKAEQREYLERKLKEFFSQTGQSTEPLNLPVQESPKPTELSTEPPKPPVQEKTEPTHVQEPPKEVVAPSQPEPMKESPPTSSKYEGLNEELLRKIESLW
jgi:outer membrane biosynthesis protein TonB